MRSTAIVLSFAVVASAQDPIDERIAAMVGELRWGLDNATEAYAVLNAARAERYVAKHRLFSKVEGGKWALARLPDAPFVQRALDAQLGKVAHQPLTNEGREFVERVIRRLETELGR